MGSQRPPLEHVVHEPDRRGSYSRLMTPDVAAVYGKSRARPANGQGTAMRRLAGADCMGVQP